LQELAEGLRLPSGGSFSTDESEQRHQVERLGSREIEREALVALDGSGERPRSLAIATGPIHRFCGTREQHVSLLTVIIRHR
jgi:hypothetical protein